MEFILYTICNNNEIPREGVGTYASPISKNLEELLEDDSVQIETEEDLIKFAKKAQSGVRYFGINFLNVSNWTNTIEFRLANGTIDADTWIQNANLFGGIVRVSEEIAQIQLKPEEERTTEEIEKLELFEQIKELPEEERLEAFLKLTIPEQKREVYRKRYRENSKEIENNPTISDTIRGKISKNPIDLKKIGKKTYTGENGITASEYQIGEALIDKDMQQEIINGEEQK